ncbi:AI-2E family transporter [Candidatus Woesebacteria bacterium]|nr:AI-2E family transporter [Candidatus Woesebacteria bacterium]
MDENKQISVSINTRTILYFIFLPLGLYALWSIKDILYSILIGFIFMSALRPAVEVMTKRGVPKKVASVIIYVCFVAVLILLVSLIFPPIIQETTSLIISLPVYITELYPNLSVDAFSQYLPTATNNIVGVIGSIFSNTFFLVSTLFFAFYFLLDDALIETVACRFLNNKQLAVFVGALKKAEKRMSSWFWGQISLMFFVGILTYIGLVLLGTRYALPLAVLAGLLEVVPNIGPLVSAIPAILIAFTSSYLSGFSVLALYIFVQQLENNIIVPVIMRRAVGLHPIVTLITLLVGGRIGGVIGIILSIPIFLFIETFFQEYRGISAAAKVRK